MSGVRRRERTTNPARSAEVWTMANRIVQYVAAWPHRRGEPEVAADPFGPRRKRAPPMTFTDRE